MGKRETILYNQHYPPGTQENYKIFSSSNLIMRKGKEIEFPEGWGGGKGSEVAKRPQPYCASRNWGQQRSPGVPPIYNILIFKKQQIKSSTFAKVKNYPYLL